MSVSAALSESVVSVTSSSSQVAASIASTTIAAVVGPAETLTVPGAPVILNVEVTGLNTEIEHTKPDDGGSTITGYQYDAIGPTLSPPASTTDNGSTVTTVLPGALSVVDLGVRAVNAIGAGPYSAYRSADEF